MMAKQLIVLIYCLLIFNVEMNKGFLHSQPVLWEKVTDKKVTKGQKRTFGYLIIIY